MNINSKLEIRNSKLKISILVLGVLLFINISYADNYNLARTKKITISAPRKDLRVGEKLTYGVYWMGVAVGEGSLQVKEIVKIDGRDAYHVVATAKTNDFMSAIYKIDDTVHTYIDTKGLYSLRFEKYQREGRYRADEIVVFDQKNHMGYYESLTNKTKKEFAVPDRVQDLASAFYYFRTLDIKPDSTTLIDVNSDEKNWKVAMNVSGTQELEIVRKGIHDVFCLMPKADFKGVISKRGKVWIYMSADKERVPLYIRIRIPFGSVTGVLEKAG